MYSFIIFKMWGFFNNFVSPEGADHRQAAHFTESQLAQVWKSSNGTYLLLLQMLYLNGNVAKYF